MIQCNFGNYDPETGNCKRYNAPCPYPWCPYEDELDYDPEEEAAHKRYLDSQC